MTEFLTKDQLLHLRGENGKILPQTVELELIEGKPNVKLIPLTKGQIVEISSKTKENSSKEFSDDQTEELISKHLVEPQVTVQELKESGKVQYIGAIVTALISVSTGIPQVKVNESKTKALENSDFLLERK